MNLAARHKAWLGVALWLVLALPPLRAPLEASMTLHMLVQMPLLALAGVWLAAPLPRPWREHLARWNHRGINGFLLASFVGMLWMVPRMLDEAVQQPWVALAKFTSIALLLGAPLALSWPRAGFVLRAVLLLEAVATAFRLGWLYLATPSRLCSVYLLDDQQRLGQALVLLGLALSLVVAGRLMWGRVRVEDPPA
ncbi:MAG: hypothetical protein K8F51_03165 [Comamonas sp.]|nr:hypothetical protein [Comamonas sp.]